MPNHELATIPCLDDNYSYLLHDTSSGKTACIDVPDASPVLEYLRAKSWTLTDILITHHHWDHVQGVADLVAATGATVTGAAMDAQRLPPLDNKVTEGDRIEIGNLHGRVMDVSGHCDNHLAFHFQSAGVVFTADSLMALGCGRLFEGTPAQMWASMLKLRALPPETLVCSGHEYTATNAAFALSVDPENDALEARAAEVRALRAAGKPTVPSTLSDEIATNPFLRADTEALARGAKMLGHAPTEVFGEIRALRNKF